MADETQAVDAADETSVADGSVDAQPLDADAASPPNEAEAGKVASVTAKAPEFAQLKPTPSRGAAAPFDRFLDVNVSVWAELGRVEVPLGELVKLDEGSVLMLDRPISEPVDLVSQGVKLARGEVIVVDDCFAIRIKEIYSNR